VAAEMAVSIPDCFRTSRRVGRKLRKRDMNSPFVFDRMYWVLAEICSF